MYLSAPTLDFGIQEPGKFCCADMNYTAEVFDQLQLLFDTKGLNDHQMHCVLRFEHRLDIELLKNVVVASIDAIPILGTRYSSSARPHWTSIDSKDFGRASLIAQTESDLEKFVVSPVDEGTGPQIRVCVLDAIPFAVAFKMNHMVCDAGGFKTYLYCLCDLYSGLMTNPQYRRSPLTGNRSIGSVLRRFSLGVKLKSLFLQGKENNLSGDAKFPMSDEGEARPFIVTSKLNRERTSALKNSGKEKGATLNDVVLTALYRRLFRWLGLSPGEECLIPVMVDMRRYLGGTVESPSLTNLSSMVSTKLSFRPDEQFDGTLARVKKEMDARKRSNPGLNACIKLALLFRTFGDHITNRLLRSKMKYPYICMTNVGILDPTRLLFGDLRPQDAYLCGAIKYKPYFQLAMSSYNGEITLSINLYGSASDRDRMLSFLAEIDAELGGWSRYPAS